MENKIVKLNIGCGKDYRQGYVNVDVRNTVKADVVCDIMDITDIMQPESVNEIIANDILEHFSFLETDKLVSKLHWIMKAGAWVEIRVPDLDVLIDHYKQGILNADRLSYLLYGAQDYEYNYHYNGFSYTSLKAKLMKAGFRTISDKIESGTNFIVKAMK